MNIDAMNEVVVVAGATGNLGSKIVVGLLTKHRTVRALVRNKRDKKAINALLDAGADVREVDYNNPLSLTEACLGATCVVSALSGLRDVIVDAQSNLLTAAVEAKVQKFIPSDYCIDYRTLAPGMNRNLDWRREFSEILSKAPIKATSVLNGMFSDLLLGEAPVILFNQRKIFFWGSADQKMDFTTIQNTAEYTALAALDNNSPRWLTIAGEAASMRDIQRIASEVEGEDFKLFRPGGLGMFKVLIKVAKTFAPGRKEVFPAWQGMQYLYDMLSGQPKFQRLDNTRYNGIKWESIADVIQAR